jgi:hypothetical protein
MREIGYHGLRAPSHLRRPRSSDAGRISSSLPSIATLKRRSPLRPGDLALGNGGYGDTLACLPVTAKGRFQHLAATGWPSMIAASRRGRPRCDFQSSICSEMLRASSTSIPR